MKIDLPVLGLAGCHGQKWKRLSRYVDWASPIHITVQQMRLRWMETSEAHSIPLHIWNENQVGTTTNAQSKHKEVLHLCRWSTHTHTTCSHTTCSHNLRTDILLILLTTCSHTTCSHTTSSHTTYSVFCVAGVALRDIYLHFVWQAWHLTTSIVTLRGRRGTYGTGLALAARLVSHGAVTPRPFSWQAWHFVTSTFTLCGRRDAWRDRLLLCVAGVALMALGWLWRRAWSAMAPWRRGVLRGRRGTSWHLPSLCVAGVALCDIYVRSTVTLCGRRGTWWYGLLLCVAGVALMALGWHWVGSGGALGQPWRRDAAAFFVAGVALMAFRDICLHFVWQAWHFVTSAFTLCGRRGTWRHRLLLCVAGVALAFVALRLHFGTCDIGFAWQARYFALSFRCQVTTAGNDVPFWFDLLSRHCQVTTGAVFASAFMDDIFCLSRPGVSVADTFSLFLGSLCCTGLSRCVVCCAPTFAVALALWHTLSNPCVFRRDGGTCCSCRHFTPRSQTAVTPRPPHTTSHLESFNTPCGEVTFDSTQTDTTQRPRHITSHFESMQAQTTYNMTRPLGASKHHITSESFNMLRGEVTWEDIGYDPVYLRVPVVDDGKITPWNKQAYQEVCDAIQHARVWILTSMDWRSVWRSCHVWPRELALKWIDAPCEDPAPECGHVIERKDSAHDRSEQVLCNRLQRFLRRLLSVRATLLHLPQSLGRSSMLRCRDLC